MDGVRGLDYAGVRSAHTTENGGTTIDERGSRRFAAKILGLPW
jgi:hypothetical protein